MNLLPTFLEITYKFLKSFQSPTAMTLKTSFRNHPVLIFS
jgi:hypothetical protein